jgi:hypothetical protein
MHKKFLITGYLTVFLLFFSGCKILTKRDYVPFNVSDASYYSWFAKGNESGTNIQIRLRDVNPEVKFDSIIFRNVRVAVYASDEGDEVIMESIIPGSSSRFEGSQEGEDKSNCLMYKYRGKRRIYILGKFRRKKMRYYL